MTGKMSNVDFIEMSAHLQIIGKMTDPKEVLEYLSKSESLAGFHSTNADFGEIRMETYHQWLGKNKPDWDEFFVKSLKLLSKMLGGGGLPSESEMEELNHPPEGYIQPMPFLRKGIVRD
jgi:hypothetical protein